MAQQQVVYVQPQQNVFQQVLVFIDYHWSEMNIFLRMIIQIKTSQRQTTPHTTRNKTNEHKLLIHTIIMS